MRRALLSLLLLLLAAPAHADPAEADIDGIAALVVGQDTPGLAVLVTKNGHVLLAKGYGYADREHQIPVTPDTVFDLASVTKQMTAQLVLKAVLAGKLDLMAPLERALPGFKQHDDVRPIRASDLLHHMSGLADYLDDYDPSQTDADVLTYANTQPLDFDPGTQFQYNNTGFVLLADVVTNLAGAKDYGSLLQTTIFDPLGMKETGSPFARSDLKPGEVAKGYKGTGGRFEPSHDESVTYGDGNVFSSINDLARYEAAFFSGALLAKADIPQLFVPGRLDDGSTAGDGGGGGDEGYAFGWFVSSASGHRLASHSGSWSGTATYYERDLDTGLSIVVLANGENCDPSDTAEMIREAYEGD